MQYQVGQLFSVIETSRENTTGDTGVEIVTNEPFDNERGSGQYTHKIYHMGRYLLAARYANVCAVKCPRWLRLCGRRAASR